LSPTEFAALEAMVDDLPRLLAEIDACGLPDTLVHGDLHPGNWRCDGLNLTLLDGGDCLVGNPAFDLRAFVESIVDPAQQGRTLSRWVQTWRRQVPGCDPVRAVALVGPVAHSCAPRRHNQRFLDHVDLTEQTYDLLDPDDRLRRALTARC